MVNVEYKRAERERNEAMDDEKKTSASLMKEECDK